eukprot:scaffold296833_cov30-Tisochrysis_lutea.AAC.1
MVDARTRAHTRPQRARLRTIDKRGLSTHADRGGQSKNYRSQGRHSWAPHDPSLRHARIHLRRIRGGGRASISEVAGD